MSVGNKHRNLVFTREQLVLDDEDYLAIANDFFSGRALSGSELTDRDRAFLQAMLVIAADASEDTKTMFDLFTIVFKGGPSATVTKVAKKFGKKMAKRWLDAHLNGTPKINALGRTAIRASAHRVEWQLRLQMHDPSELTNFLVTR